MVILAHRAYRNGPDPSRENRLPAIIDCLRQGWGVEIDIRRAPSGRFYLSHDPLTDITGCEADPVFESIRAHAAAPVAVNVKELGYEADLLQYLRDRGVLGRVFLFDMEFLEDEPGHTARALRALDPGVAVAVRVSDRGEPVARALATDVAGVVWADEFDRLWMTEDDVRALKTRGKTVHAISCEIHGFPEADMTRRWEQFAEWGVDGVCTDFPERAAAHLGMRTGAPA